MRKLRVSFAKSPRTAQIWLGFNISDPLDLDLTAQRSLRWLGSARKRLRRAAARLKTGTRLSGSGGAAPRLWRQRLRERRGVRGGRRQRSRRKTAKTQFRPRFLLGASWGDDEPDCRVRAGHRRPQRACDGERRRADSGEAARTRERGIGRKDGSASVPYTSRRSWALNSSRIGGGAAGRRRARARRLQWRRGLGFGAKGRRRG